MQSNKPSKTTKKPAAPAPVEAADTSKTASAPEVKAKAAASKSSPSKKSEINESAPGKHHRRSISAIAEPSAPNPQETAVSPRPKAAAAAAGAGSGAPEVDPGDIAQLAYSYWTARGHHHGSSEEDWLRAEEELKTKR